MTVYVMNSGVQPERSTARYKQNDAEQLQQLIRVEVRRCCMSIQKLESG